MKKIISTLMLIMIALLVMPMEADAHAKSKRKNRCKRSKKYYTKAAVNGPKCSRKSSRGWSCNGQTRDYSLFEKDCVCDWYKYFGAKEAVKAYATSYNNACWSRTWKKTSCKRYRAGSELPEMMTASKLNVSVPIINIADIYTSTDFYDYDKNTITIDSLGGLLHLASDDFDAEYSIINFEIAIITVDENGNEQEEILFMSQAKILNGELIISGDDAIFSESDFIVHSGNNDLEASFFFDSKTIPLGVDITQETEIEIRLSSDIGNLEAGPSEIDLDPITISTSYNLATREANITLNSVISTEGSIIIRDINGAEVKTISNITLLANEPKEIFVSTSTFARSSFYYVVQFISSEGVTVLDKFIKID